MTVTVTVTPNPSLDRTIEIPELRRGAVLRATGTHLDPGGKGVNVARALTVNGGEAVAVLPCGGAEGQQLSALLAAEGIETVAVPVDAPVRVNVTVAEPDGTVTKLNEPGAGLGAAEVTALLRAVTDRVQPGGWVAGCGSLPPGAPADFYARLVTAVHERRGLVAVDTSGPPLAPAVAAGPDLVKPNAEELGELVGTPLGTVGEVVDAAATLRARGCATVLVSLGPDGAVLVDADGAWRATTPPVAVLSTVGAGDAVLAGALAVGGRGRDALVEGVAWGAAAVQLPGTHMPRPHEIDRTAVTVAAPDPSRRLSTAD